MSPSLPKNLVILSRRIQNSYWFLPTLMGILAVVASSLSLYIDHFEPPIAIPKWFYLFSGGSDGARDVVGVVAGSIMSVAGVTFSIAVVVLSLASQQYGSRLLRNFLGDRAIHFTIGMFISTFIYCLLILPSIHAGADSGRSEFIPRFSVTISILLGIFCVFVLIYFIHHVSLSIQSEFLTTSTSRQLLSTIEEIYPEKTSPRENGTQTLDDFANNAIPGRVSSLESGYFQAVDIDQLMRLATRHSLRIQVIAKPGDFIVKGDDLLSYWPKNAVRDDQKVFNRTIRLGSQKTIDQDPGFGFDMLVEMAVRALSPGVNDPFTAIQCIEHLREALGILAVRSRTKGTFLDAKGNPRIVMEQLSFQDALERTIPVLKHYASNSPKVLKSLQMLLWKLDDTLEESPSKDLVKRYAHDFEAKSLSGKAEDRS